MPAAITAKEDGTIFFVERAYQMVREYSPGKGFFSLFPLSEKKRFEYIQDPPEETNMDSYFPSYPTSLICKSKDILFLADGRHKCVYEINLESRRMKKVMKTPKENYQEEIGPIAIALGLDETLWVHDTAEKCIRGFQKNEMGSWQKIDAVFWTSRIKKIDKSFSCGTGGAGMVCR